MHQRAEHGWDKPCKSIGLRTVLWTAGGEIPPADQAILLVSSRDTRWDQADACDPEVRIVAGRRTLFHAAVLITGRMS
jgi:hypothetical protein